MSMHLLVLCLALLQQEGLARRVPPDCNSPKAVRVAKEALEQINQDRTNGYILSLDRLSLTPEKEKGGKLYNLTIDVMETKCHIASRKPWKQFPATAAREVCPDCPRADNVNAPDVKEAASLSLRRFSEERLLTNYFTPENITRASSQWRLILETMCSKKTDANGLSDCPPMDCQFARKGFCSGSHMEQFEIGLPVGRKDSSFKNQRLVKVKCEIYEPQAAAVGEQASGNTGHQHNTHTHRQPHAHTHPVPPSSGLAVSRPRGSLCSSQVFPSSRLLPGTTQTQSGLRQTQAMIGRTRTVDL